MHVAPSYVKQWAAICMWWSRNVHTSATHTLIQLVTQISKSKDKLDQVSQFQVTRKGQNATIACSCGNAAVEMQLATCTCSIPTSPSNLKLRKFMPNGFPSRNLY